MKTIEFTDNEISALQIVLKMKVQLSSTFEDIAELGVALQTIKEKLEAAARHVEAEHVNGRPAARPALEAV